jgi:hypothetical protein
VCAPQMGLKADAIPAFRKKVDEMGALNVDNGKRDEGMWRERLIPCGQRSHHWVVLRGVQCTSVVWRNRRVSRW